MLTIAEGIEDVADNSSLRARKISVLRAWAREMPLGAAMVTPLADVLDHMVSVVVGRDATTEGLSDAVAVHVEKRFGDGFTIDAVLEEYALLRRCIQTELRNRRFDHVIDVAVGFAAKHFLAQREELRDRLIGVLAHDLRSPLACVTMANEMLMTDQRTEHERSMLALVLDCSDRMRRMVNEVLGWSKNSSSFPALKRHEDLGTLLGEIANETRVTHGQNAVSLEVRGDLRASIDRDRIHQAVTNLVRNAIEHGMGTAHIHANEADAGRTIVLVVRNRGALRMPIGSDVADPFKRRKRSTTSRGLGLYIVDQIAQSHGASLDMASAGDETTVTIRLPTLREP